METDADEGAGAPGGAVGAWFCVEKETQAVGEKRCEHGHIFFNSTIISLTPSDSHRRAFACHETGHSLGLHHDNFDTDTPEIGGFGEDKQCMETDLQLEPEHFVGSHNGEHLDDQY